MTSGTAAPPPPAARSVPPAPPASDPQPAAAAASAIRAFAVTFGGSVVLDVLAGASVLGTLRSLKGRRVPRPAALLGSLATAYYFKALRPRHLRWGAEPGDEARAFPGDEQLDAADGLIVHAVDIEAPPEDVWPWVAQIGQDRAGFYSYRLLENLAGCEMPTAEEIHPEWQHREVGEEVMLHPRAGLEVTLFEPGRALGLEGWGTFLVIPRAGRRCRLVVRGRVPHGPAALFSVLLMEIPHFVMERRMLLEIKRLAERGGTDA